MKNYCLLLLFLLNFCLYSQSGGDKLLVAVNGKAITMNDVILETYRDEMKLSKQLKGKALSDKISELRTYVLQELVKRQIVYNEFELLGYQVPEKPLQETINRIVGNIENEEFEKQLEGLGMTMKDFRQKNLEKLAYDMMLGEYCRKKVSATPKEIFKYYKKTISNYKSDNTVSLGILLIKKDDKELAEKLLRYFKSDKIKNKTTAFSKMVKEYSIGPNKENSGFVEFKVKEMRPELFKMVDGKDINNIYGPANITEGIAFVYFFNREIARTKSLKEVKKAIEQKIRAEKYNIIVNEFLKKLENKSTIKRF